ncbi:hypothetical protein K6I34_005438 [Streptomyces sp. UNOC14_S4]|nr:hypothetical protein [Streptomyces sp. UNOC14_S4]
MLLTAVSAALLLCAVWFVPSAHAQSSPPAETETTDSARLADSGSVDTTPYVCGGVAFLAAGGVLVTTAARRARAR